MELAEITAMVVEKGLADEEELRGDNGGKFFFAQGRESVFPEDVVDDRDAYLVGVEDLDTDESSLSIEVENHFGLDPFAVGALFARLSQQGKIGYLRLPILVCNLKNRFSHGFFLSTGYAVTTSRIFAS